MGTLSRDYLSPIKQNPAFTRGGSCKLYRGRHVLINVDQLFFTLHRLNNFKGTGGTHLG